MTKSVNILPLKKRSEFVDVAENGKKFKTAGIIVQALDNNSKSDTRVGFTVTKKQGNAVLRNRIKRRLRSLSKEIMSEYGKTGYHYVLIGQSQAANIPYSQLKEDLIEALKKL